MMPMTIFNGLLMWLTVMLLLAIQVMRMNLLAVQLEVSAHTLQQKIAKVLCKRHLHLMDLIREESF